MSYQVVPAGYEDEQDDWNGQYLCDGVRRLRITLVPEITDGAGINGENFQGQLSPIQGLWFEGFCQTWNSYKRDLSTHQCLRKFLMEDPQPLLLALKFVANCPGCNSVKPKTMAVYILECVCSIYKQNPEIAAGLDDNTRMIAFNFVKNCGIGTLCNGINEAYDLTKIRELLLPKLKEFVTLGNYRDAAQWAMLLKVTNVFDHLDLVLPLFLQGKTSLAEDYLDIAKHLQKPFVQFLDSLLDKSKSVSHHFERIAGKYHYIDVSSDMLTHKTISKLTTRLAKKYDISESQTPNLAFSKASGQVHFMFHRYKAGKMGGESFKENVCDIATTTALQLDLVQYMGQLGEPEEAAYWALHFRLLPADLPGFIRAEMEKLKSRPSADVVDAPLNGGPAKSENSQSWLTLNLPADCILMVDTKQKFLEMIDYLQGQQMIAFDSEWKPTFCNDVVCLLQLATRERVYLVDCLSPHIKPENWRQLGSMVFNNLEIMKLGFSLKNDMLMLHKSLPLQLDMQATSCYLDLHMLWRTIKAQGIVQYPFGDSTLLGDGLSVLSELCLGKQIDKSNQCSNWANRPLRPDQVVYAALDAHCLLLIYDVLIKHLAELKNLNPDQKGLDIERIVEEITTSKTGYLANVKKSTEANGSDVKVFANAKAEAPVSDCSRFQTVSDIKFLCDIKLENLCVELRKLGISAVNAIFENRIPYVEKAKQEHLFVLTDAERYKVFVPKLPMTRCLEVPLDITPGEQAVYVLRELSIQVEAKNLFTRCVICNENEFIYVKKHDLQKMRYNEVFEGSTAPTLLASFHVDPRNRTMILYDINEDIKKDRMTYRKKPIKFKFRRHIAAREPYFLICNGCGICYWDGSHTLPRCVTKHLNADWVESACTSEDRNPC